MSQSDFVSRGQALVSAGQYQEAVKVCRLGLLGRPTTVEGRVVLGQALLALKRYDEVLAEMRVALELDHTSVAAQLLKGEALLRKGDPHAALDVLQRARLQVPNDPKITGLMAEAQRSVGRPHATGVHPAVGFVGGTGANKQVDEDTRHYPNHGAEEEDTGDDDGLETTGDSYTRPTSLAAPTAKKRTPKPELTSDATPPPSVLAVGDRSGTVEVDPDADGVELDGDDDFGEPVAPPLFSNNAPTASLSRPRPIQQSATVNDRPRPIQANDVRGQVIPARAPRAELPLPLAAKRPIRPKQKADISTVELEDDEMIEVDEPVIPTVNLSGSAVRSAVKMPSGPLEAAGAQAANRPTAYAPVVAPPPHLAQMIANAPHVLQVQQSPHSHTIRGPAGPIAAALPTLAAQPPQPPMPLGQPPSPHAARPTVVALSQPQQQSATAVDNALFGAPQPPGAAWARATVAAGQNPMPMPMPMPHNQPQFALEGSSPSAIAMLEPSQSSARPLKTGMRKGRSRMQIIVWFLIGALVIGGGVFAGFQIRAMRLKKQIAAAREQAITLAKADTWKGWVGARDRLAGIAQASATPDNLAALVHTRALVAYEFGDGIADAKGSLEALAGQTGLDIDLASAYVALAQSDPKAAVTAADAALKLAPEDPAALYVAGQAALLAGDAPAAIKHFKAALEREQRPLYAVGLARAHAEMSGWKDALAAVDKALASSPDHPGALIERAHLLAASGQIGPSTTMGAEVRAQLAKIVAEGLKQANDQPRGVSPAQVGFTNLVLTYVDFLRGDTTAMQADFRAALSVNLDEQRFAEHAVETLYAIGELGGARAAAEGALAGWPSSRRARIAMARVLLAQGKPQDALNIISRTDDLKQLPMALAVRGQIHFALDDLDAARKDFDAALKRAPDLEIAIVGRTWVDIQGGDIPAAKERIEPKHAQSANAGIATAYAAVLRADPKAREKAKTILEKVVAGAPGLEVTRAQLELARIYRDTGDYDRSAKMYADASRTGSQEARLENALLLIESRDPVGGRDTLDGLLKTSADPPPATLLLEAARARMLAGDHSGAVALLDLADKTANVVRWKYDRERGRLALRKGDYAGAAGSLTRALEGCGDDAETFLLAAEVAAADDKQGALGARVKVLVPQRLKSRAEAQIIAGKLLLSKGEEASKAYETAKTMLEADKAAPRRFAQAHLGRAIVAYDLRNDPAALNALDLAIELDPSLYEAYLYYADIKKDKDPKKALERALLAIKFNPDLVDGHQMVGTIAARLGQRKLLNESITKLTEIAPQSEALKALKELR